LSDKIMSFYLGYVYIYIYIKRVIILARDTWKRLLGRVNGNEPIKEGRKTY